jgi:hypothetical protein
MAILTHFTPREAGMYRVGFYTHIELNAGAKCGNGRSTPRGGNSAVGEDDVFPYGKTTHCAGRMCDSVRLLLSASRNGTQHDDLHGHNANVSKGAARGPKRFRRDLVRHSDHSNRGAQIGADGAGSVAAAAAVAALRFHLNRLPHVQAFWYWKPSQ